MTENTWVALRLFHPYKCQESAYKLGMILQVGPWNSRLKPRSTWKFPFET